MPSETKAAPPATHKQGRRREITEINLLFEISRTLDMSIDLKDVLGPVLEQMARHMSMLRGTITILDRKTGEIFVDEAYGLSESQKERGRYKIGEGVTGMVVRTGKPAVVPRISREPLFLDRTGARTGPQKEDISFICVPIMLENEVIGTLSADRLFEEAVSYDEDIRLLSIIASMIAQAVNLRQSAQEIIEENIRLKEELNDRYRPRQHHRKFQGDAGGLPAHRAGRPDEHDRIDPGRVGHRQGAGGPRYPCRERPRRQRPS